MNSMVVVGGFGSTIELFELNVNLETVKSSTLVFKGSNEVGDKPSFLDIVDERIYCVHEVSSFKGEKSGGLSFLKIGGLKIYKIQSQFSSGEDPTHILVNPRYKCAYVSNYLSGHFAVTKIKDDGLLGGGLYIESYDVGSGVVADRQQDSHPHAAYVRNKFVYVVDLGADKILHYMHGDGTEFATANPEYTSTPPGSGPRHMAFHPKHDLAFLLTELSNEVLVYKIDNANGTLSLVASHKYLSTDQTGENYGTEIVVHPNGKFLYLSNRVNGCLISYRILDSNGKLEKIECFQLLGTWPRHFAIHSSGKVLLCADQFKEIIEVFVIDESSGKLDRIQTIDCKNKPSCIVFKDVNEGDDVITYI